MKKEVLLTICAEQRFRDEEPETTELVTEGQLTVSGSRVEFSYEESELTGLTGTRTVFCIDDGRVILTRTGGVESRMVFSVGQEDRSLYDIGCGALMITVTATRVYYDIVPDGGTIDLVYEISIENTEAGIIDYHLDIRAKE